MDVAMRTVISCSHQYRCLAKEFNLRWSIREPDLDRESLEAMDPSSQGDLEHTWLRSLGPPWLVLACVFHAVDVYKLQVVRRRLATQRVRSGLLKYSSGVRSEGA